MSAEPWDVAEPPAKAPAASSATPEPWQVASTPELSIPRKLWEGVKGGMLEMRDAVQRTGDVNPAFPPEVRADIERQRAEATRQVEDYRALKPSLGMTGTVGEFLPELAMTAVPLARTSTAISKLPLAMKALGRAAPLVADVGVNAGYEAGKSALSGGDVALDAAKGAGGAVAGRAFVRSLVALGGAARGALTGRVATSGMTPEARALVEAGITPTPGQAFGGLTGMAENASKHLPGFGSAVERGQGRARAEYATAEINRALKPLETAVEGTGLKAVARANELIRNSYNDLADRTFMAPDAARTAMLRAGADMQQIPSLTEAQYSAVADFIERRIQPLAVSAKQAGENLTGRTAKDIDSDIGTLARKFSTSADPSQHPLGDAYYSLLGHWRGVLGASDATAKAQLDATNAAFRNMLPVAKAADRAGNAKGVFTPNQLRQAGNSGGGALNLSASPFNDAAMEVIGPTGGGKLSRNVIGGLSIQSPTALAAIAGGAGLGHLLYSERGVKAMLGAMSMPPNTRQWVNSLPPEKQQEFVIRMIGEVPELRQLAAQVGRQVATEGAAQ